VESSQSSFTFFDRTNMYNHSFPSNDNPYTLDLSEPYKAAVLNELLVKYSEDPINCSFEGLTYREEVSKGPEQSISLVVNSRREKCLKGLGRAVATLRQGTHQIQLPAGRECAHDRACDQRQRVGYAHAHR